MSNEDRQFDAEDTDMHDNFCRLCCDSSGYMTELFPDNKIPNRDLLWMILECTTLRITFDEDPDARVCKKCVQKMNEFCEYRLECLRNDRKLKKDRKHKRISLHIDGPSEGNPVLQFDQIIDPLENSRQNYVDIYDQIEGENSYHSHSESAIKLDELCATEDDSTLPCLKDDKNKVAIEHEIQITNKIPKHEQKMREKKRRIRKILLYEEYSYQLLSSRPKCDSITWGCCWRKLKECKGTIGTKANGQILGNVIPQHNHPPEPFENKKPKAILIHAFREVDNIYLPEPYEIMKNRTGGDVLMYSGNRFAYSHSRKDGCRIWKCNSHRNCTVSIYLCPDGRIFKLADSEHSKDEKQPKRDRPMDGHSLSDISANIEHIYPNPSGTFNYKIIKNTNKRNVLIYQGDRYSFYYRKSNGWVVWRCTVSKVCQAMLYQLTDESVVVLGETTHNHLKASDVL